MKNIHSVLFVAFLAFSFFSCQKETINPSSEELIVYESGPIVVDRGANTATITWSSTAAVDARFEVLNAATGVPLYGYGWINFTGASNTANYTISTGSTVKLRIKARRASGAPASTLTYSFSSTCTISGCGCGTATINAPAGTAWTSIPGNSITTGACL